jgi:hypothetical protein
MWPFLWSILKPMINLKIFGGGLNFFKNQFEGWWKIVCQQVCMTNEFNNIVKWLQLHSKIDQILIYKILIIISSNTINASFLGMIFIIINKWFWLFLLWLHPNWYLCFGWTWTTLFLMYYENIWIFLK